MPFDREETLKKAEKLLRQGRLDAAIAEYTQVVAEAPEDWATRNTLGDLHVRAGQPLKAAEQFGRIAEHFMVEGFYPRAAALYKKLLKLNPADEASQLNLADISHKQGLLADAKAHLNAIASRRRARGDRAGAAEIVVRLGSIDAADFDARLAAAAMLAEMGDDDAAAARYRDIHADLVGKGRHEEALGALREAVRLNPYDQQARAALVKAAVAAGDREIARQYLDRETAGDDPPLLAALLDLHLEAGQVEEARAVLPRLLGLGDAQRHQLLEMAWSMAPANAGNAYVIAGAVVDAAADGKEFEDASTILHEFLARVPHHVPALLRLIEVCVDGGLEGAMCEAQAQLADAYLEMGQAAEARHIAEDLVAREPWERAHIERFRRALVLQKVPDPDLLIAERLSGQSPFTATDPFADVPAGDAYGADSPAPAADEATNGQDGTAGDAAPSQTGAVVEQPEAVAEEVAGPASPSPAPASFSDFHTEIERQSGADQSAQHMTLARTYLEMGMPDEALGSLEVASRSTRFRFEAASRLGRLYKDRGDVHQAVEWLERAAEAPAPTLDEGRALLYDLGILVEASGETARALAIFLELQSEAGEYRDVAQRVERLARAEAGG